MVRADDDDDDDESLSRANTSELAEGEPAPKMIAMLLCDSFIRDVKSKKGSVIGVFNNVNADEFPSKIQSGWLFISMTNLHRPTRFSIQVAPVESPDDPDELLQFGAAMSAPNQLLEDGIPLGSVEFLRPGEYLMRVVSGGQVIGERPFSVKLNEKQAEVQQ